MHCVPCSCKPGAHPRRQPPPPPPSPPHSSSPSCPPAPPPPSSSALYPLRSVSTSRGVTPKILHRSTPSAAASADSSCRFSVRDSSLMNRLREAALRSMPACGRWDRHQGRQKKKQQGFSQGFLQGAGSREGLAPHWLGAQTTTQPGWLEHTPSSCSILPVPWCTLGPQQLPSARPQCHAFHMLPAPTCGQPSQPSQHPPAASPPSPPSPPAPPSTHLRHALQVDHHRAVLLVDAPRPLRQRPRHRRVVQPQGRLQGHQVAHCNLVKLALPQEIPQVLAEQLGIGEACNSAM
jgi:hypothetical protein